MSSGTFQPSLLAGAARPGFDGSRVALAPTFGTTATSGAVDASFTSITCAEMWLQVWDINATKPAYPVAHTDRTTPRPLERIP
jgi:hypothetical protein